MFIFICVPINSRPGSSPVNKNIYPIEEKHISIVKVIKNVEPMYSYNFSYAYRL